MGGHVHNLMEILVNRVYENYLPQNNHYILQCELDGYYYYNGRLVFHVTEFIIIIIFQCRI